MRRTLAVAASAGLAVFTALVTAPQASSSTGGGGPAPGSPVVVVAGLDNPRQLNWDGEAGRRLVVAEAGRGGEGCIGEGEEQLCAGTSGRVSVVDHPSRVRDGEADPVLEGLLSVAGPDGSFATGADGADLTPDGSVVAAITGPPPGGLPPDAAAIPGVEQLGQLVVADDEGEVAVPLADLAAFEAENNPDGAQSESNPYAALSVGRSGAHRQVLVADAAANAVLRVVLDDDGGSEVSVFHAWPTVPDEDELPEYVPTSLARDGDGNVYVGGLGSEQAGQAAVTKFSRDGELLEEWRGFTGITGVAVDGEGGYLYVSQLFGTTPLLPPGEVPSDEAPPTEGVPGDVVRVDLEDGTYVTEPVPFPAGVAADGDGRVYVSAFSVADADGSEPSDAGPGSPGGQVWSIAFGDEEALLPVTGSPFPPADTGGEFMPVAADYYFPFSFEGCDTTLFVRSGDVREVEQRVTEEEDGDVYVELRGRETVDFLAADGRSVEEVDASGDGRVLIRADGSYSFAFDAPEFYYTEPDEEEAVDALGLPRVFLITEGTIDETSSPEGEVEITEAPTGVTDVCTLLT